MIKLVLVRHGQSEWNLENRFTGWTDVELSPKGIQEAKEAGIALKNKGYHFDLLNTPDIIHRGDIIIESSQYGHYAGELQIALQDMTNTGMSNVVGRIKDEELFMLDYIKPWQKFKLRLVEDKS